MRLWPRTPSEKRSLLHLIIGVNTLLIFLNLFVLSDSSGTIVSFLTCVVAWMGVLAIDRLEELEARSKSKSDSHHQIDANSNNDNDNVKE